MSSYNPPCLVNRKVYIIPHLDYDIVLHCPLYLMNEPCNAPDDMARIMFANTSFTMQSVRS